MAWIFYLFLIIVFGLMILYVAESIIELDQWIRDTERREKEGYDYIHNRFLSENPVKKLTPKYRVQPKLEPKLVNMLTPKAENFPQTPEEAKKKIENLLKKVQKTP